VPKIDPPYEWPISVTAMGRGRVDGVVDVLAEGDQPRRHVERVSRVCGADEPGHGIAAREGPAQVGDGRDVAARRRDESAGRLGVCG